MIVYNSPTAELSFDKDVSRFSLTWKPECRSSSESDLQKDLEMILEFIREHGVRHMVSDSRHYPFHDNMEMQGWLEFEYFPKLSGAGVKAFAVVADPEVVEEYRNEKGGLFADPEQDYFTDLAEAHSWLDSLG